MSHLSVLGSVCNILRLDAVRIVGLIAEMHERFCCLSMVVLVAVSSSTACKIIESMMRHPVPWGTC